MSDYGYTPPPSYQPYGAPPPYGRPAGTSTALVIVVGILLAVVIVAATLGLAYLVGRGRPNASRPNPSGSPQLNANSGRVVFTDDFHDPSSGWSTQPFASGTTLSYTGGQYVIAAKGALNHFAESPYSTAVDQVGMSVTATQSAGAPEGAGFGVTCDTGRGDQHLRYQFLVEVGHHFYIDEKTGADGGSVIPTVVEQGDTSRDPGPEPMTVTGQCITGSDGHTTLLVLYVDGTELADITETANVPAGQWFTGIDVSSEDQASSAVTVTKFEERDLSG